VSGYKYDVFISYSRHGTVRNWLLNHFYPRLVECLVDEMEDAPKMFLDKEMSRGVHWPSQLENALQGSKILVAVLSAPYFRSKWCMTELDNMRAREKVLGLASPERPQGLIYPIRFADSSSFENEGRMRAWWDFKGLDNPDRGFQESRDWHPFQQRVRECAQDLATLLKQVPPWRPDWPAVESPEPPLPPPPPLPRFDR
jgi:hypothetical protein